MTDRMPRLAAVILTLVLVLAVTSLLACEGQTITFEESTEEADGSRTIRVSSSSDDGTPGPEPILDPTATPRPRVVFPPMSDGAALMALFDATGGDGWSNNGEWLYNEDLGQWHGVTTDAAGRVIALDLSSIGLSGELPEEIGYLTGLTELDLSDNSLTGALPAEIGSLVNLEELYLNGNQFSGSLPATLSALTALTDLHLHGNQFGAELPAALAALTELDSLTIWNNRFTWVDSYAPGLLADMVGLVALYESTGGENWRERSGWLYDLSVAAWSGVSIGGDGSVTGLDLSENELTGELPPQFGGLASLKELNLSGNQLEGEIPETIGSLTALEELYLNDNQLEGGLPAEIGNLTALTMLHLHNNQLAGNLPSGIGAMDDLEELSVHTNRLSGPVPAVLGNLSDLEVLWLHDNQFSGELPTELAGLGNLEQLSLFGNKLEWADAYAPGIVADMVGLLALYGSTDGESWGQRTGWLSDPSVATWSGVSVGGGSVTGLDLSENGLSGELPPQLGGLTSLTELNLSTNQLGKEIPSSFGSLVNLEELVLSNNQLTGGISLGFANLSKLKRLHLNNNQLSGSIPADLGDLSNLVELNVASNLLNGTVPPELGNLSKVELLYLDNNDLSGELPTELGNLSNLEHVSVWDNNLTWADHYENGVLADTVALVALLESTDADAWGYGSWGGTVGGWKTYRPLEDWELLYQGDPVSEIVSTSGGRVTELNFSKVSNMSGKLPAELGLLTGLERLHIPEIPNLSGELPTTIGNLTRLRTLHVVGTGLGGELPREFGNAIGLREVHLNNNGFTGTIPAELGQIVDLQVLNLAGNRLSGAVPPELGNLSGLELLYLDNNQLSGELPSELGKLPKLEQVSVWANNLNWADHYENGVLADTVALVALFESTNSGQWGYGSWGGIEGGWMTYRSLGNWEFHYQGAPISDIVTTAGGRVIELNFSTVTNMSGKIPPELGLLTGLKKLYLPENAELDGCIPASLRGIDYTGDLPFCTGPTSKKALTPPGASLVG